MTPDQIARTKEILRKDADFYAETERAKVVRCALAAIETLEAELSAAKAQVPTKPVLTRGDIARWAQQVYELPKHWDERRDGEIIKQLSRFAYLVLDFAFPSPPAEQGPKENQS